MVFTTRGSPPRPCKPISSETPKIPAAAPSPKICRHHRRRRRPLPSSTSTATRRLIRSSATPVDRESPRSPARSSLLAGAAAAARYFLRAHCCCGLLSRAAGRLPPPSLDPPRIGHQQSSAPRDPPLRGPVSPCAGRLRVRLPPLLGPPPPPLVASAILRRHWLGRSAARCRFGLDSLRSAAVASAPP
ncbi:hypothetical protein Scep_006606 [Stephania cephalantha]|uniref:Uncharacterized protein n=1 Tax=Stephania cephalantha TaxID=152367 RepID=A0AAP0PME1_9MAGN